MRLEEHFESSSTLQRNERVKIGGFVLEQRRSRYGHWRDGSGIFLR